MNSDGQKTRGKSTEVAPKNYICVSGALDCIECVESLLTEVERDGEAVDTWASMHGVAKDIISLSGQQIFRDIELALLLIP